MIENQQLAKQNGDRRTRAEITELTSRKTKVLQLVAEGKANKQTAAEPKISIKTVEKHRQSPMQKLNIHDTAGLIKSCVQITIME